MEFLKDFNQKLFFQYIHYIKKKKSLDLDFVMVETMLLIRLAALQELPVITSSNITNCTWCFAYSPRFLEAGGQVEAKIIIAVGEKE